MSASLIDLSSSTLISNNNNTSIIGNNATLSLSTTSSTTTTTETIADPSDAESIEYTVTVVNVSGSNYYFINGVQTPVLTMKRGSTYTFNQSDYSNLNHPIAIKSDSLGTQTTTSSGIPGYNGSQTVYQPAYPSAPSDLRYYCSIHGNGMGNTITMNNPSTTTQTTTTTTSTYLDLINSLSSYKNFNIYRPEFHHIHSTYSGNLSFMVTSASGAQDTILRLWKVIKPSTLSDIYGYGQIGSDIDGISASDNFGQSVSTSDDGTIVAIGSPVHDNSKGHVRVYQYSSESWSQLGSDIDGAVSSDENGYSVSLSSDGTKLAIGSPVHDSSKGHIRVYQYSSGSWSQLGSDIDGAVSGDKSGWSVSISNDGTKFVVGSPDHDSSKGHIRVYQYSSGSWSQLGSDIDGDGASDQFGYSVSMSGDGTIIAASAHHSDGSDKGYTKVYNQLFSWSQLGSDIDGEAAGDISGYSISMNSDGTIVAIGAHGNDGNGTDSGHVRVYQYSSGSWSQLGSDIDGEAAGDYSGESVSINSDGTIVAIGAHKNDGNGTHSGHVRVYQYNGSAWVQLGSDIDGEAISDHSGRSVSLSSDGTIVAIGAHFNGTESGHVRIYQYSGGSWSQLGSDIDGEANYDYYGLAVSMSSDGTIVAIGGNGNDGNGTDSGHVRVYQYSSGSWSQLGSDIDGEAAGDKSGQSVSLSSDGTILAIGAPQNDGNGTDSGHVRVYQYSSGSWSQLGSDIDGEAAGDESGQSVSISNDGTIVAIGAHKNDGNGTSSGHVRVYKYSSGSWSQLGSDIDGEAAGDESGDFTSVSMSSDGTIVAISAGGNDGNGSNSGHVRIYQYSSNSWSQLADRIDGEAVGDKSGYSISLNNDGTKLAIGAPYNDGGGTDSGHTRIYQYGGVSYWSQLGSDIDGEGVYNYSGYSVSMSGDGTIVAIGSPYSNENGSNSGHVSVYEYSSGSWSQLGSDIDGEAAHDLSGYSVSLSNDGTIVAIGAPQGGSRAGIVRIYQYSSGSWSQLGSNIGGEATNDESGQSVSLSSDGTIVAIGAWFNHDGAFQSGHVRVYQYSSGSWSQLGSDIDGESAFDRSGTSVSINSDGTIVAIGAPKNDGGGSNSGHVRVYQYSSGSWSQLGSDIDGELSSHASGTSVSLNSDGTKLAIGSPGRDAGQVQVYQYSSGSWSQLGSDIDGEGAGDQFGNAVSLSSDGTIVAIGGRYNNSYRGHARIYQYNGSAWVQLSSDLDGEAGGDFYGFSVSLSNDGTIVSIGGYGHSSLRGHVKIYQYIPGWSQLGSDIDGDAGDLSGTSVSLINDGTKVAIGSPGHDSSKGTTKIYQYSSGSWSQYGADIDGTAGDMCGHSVALSGDGSKLSIGCIGHDSNKGTVRSYQYQITDHTYQQFTEDQYVNVDITNSSSLTLATGTDATKVPATNMYMLWRVLNDNMNGTNEFEYPNFSSLYPLTSEQTIQYTSPPVVGQNGSAFDFILESGEEYILEYGESGSSESGGSYQINIGLITNIETAFTTVDTVDPTGAFLGYVDIPSTLGDNQTERAYVFFDLDNSSLSSAGEKGTILMNRIRKNRPTIPENSNNITPNNNLNTSFTTTRPYRNIPSGFVIENGGENFNVGDHIVVCNKYSIHEENNVDLFTTYRDGIFSNLKKAIYSLIIEVTSITSNSGIEGIIDGIKIVNFNNIMSINNPDITIPKLDNLSSTSASYPDSTSPYYVFVFDENYLTNTSSSSLNINCSGAVLSVGTYSTMLLLPEKYNNYETNYFQEHFVYIPYFNDKYNFFSNTDIIGQNYVYHSNVQSNSNVNTYSSNFVKYSDSVSSMTAIPNSLDNAYYRKNISSHKITELNNNTTDHISMHKSIPIIFSGLQYTTNFDNVVESSYTQNKAYIIIDSNRPELNNITLSEINILPFTKDSQNPLTFSEKYIVSGNSVKQFKVKLNTLLVPHKFKGVTTSNLRYISLHISNQDSESKQLYGSTNNTGGLLKCVIVDITDSQFLKFECNETPIIQLNIKDNLSIKLFDPHGNILEPYEDENHILIESNENIQVSLTLELTEIKDDNETDNIEISNNVENNVENNVDSGTLIFKKRDNIGSTLYSESYKPNLESDRKMNKTNFSNLEYDPKLNKF